MSEEHHPNCVMVAPDMGSGRSLAEWLTKQGFRAVAVEPNEVATPGDVLGISSESIAGVEVRIVDAEQVEAARQAISEHKELLEQLKTREEVRAARTGTTTATCEDCGQSSEWPAAEMGTTQTCPHCSHYMDVPDPEESWDDIDFSAEESESDDPNAEGEVRA